MGVVVYDHFRSWPPLLLWSRPRQPAEDRPTFPAVSHPWLPQGEEQIFEEEEEAREERMRRRKRSCCDDEDGREVLAPTLTPSHVEDDEAPLLLLLLLATSGLYHRSFFGAARVSLRRTVRRFRRCRIHGFHRGRSRFF